MADMRPKFLQAAQTNEVGECDYDNKTLDFMLIAPVLCKSILSRMASSQVVPRLGCSALSE